YHGNFLMPNFISQKLIFQILQKKNLIKQSMFFVKEIVDLEETIMKTIILSAIVALAIFIPIFLVGGTIYHLAIFVLSMQGLREFLNMMETKKEIPLFIKIVSYLFMALFILGTTSVENITFGIDLRLISGIFLV